MGRPPKHYNDAELAALRDRRNELRREQYRLDGGKRKAENQAWKDAHREQVRQAGRLYQRRRRQLDPKGYDEKQRDWRRKNPDKTAQYQHVWRQNKGRGYHARWHADNKKKNPVLYMWRNCRNRAKVLGVEFSITQQDIIVPDVCPVLGIKLCFNHGKKGFYCDESPSVDRFDNKKGYTKDNIRIISWRANKIKGDANVDEIRRLLAWMESHP